MAYTIEPIWFGKPVVILAGGPSLSAAQVRLVAIARLEDKCRVIAVNDAVYLAWWADWLHAYDSRWWSWHVQRVQHFRGIKTTVQEETPDACVTGKLIRTGVDGFDRNPWAVRGNNSGYQAICIAAHAGASRILLLGFDMKGSHWFGDHPVGPIVDPAGLAACFSSLSPFLSERGISIINCGPDSALDCFPKAPLQSIL